MWRLYDECTCRRGFRLDLRDEDRLSFEKRAEWAPLGRESTYLLLQQLKRARRFCGLDLAALFFYYLAKDVHCVIIGTALWFW